MPRKADRHCENVGASLVPRVSFLLHHLVIDHQTLLMPT